MYFWPTVREHHPAGDTLADEAAGREQEAKEVLARLDKLDASDSEFERQLGTFTSAARVRIAFEETQVWPTPERRRTGQDIIEVNLRQTAGLPRGAPPRRFSRRCPPRARW